RQPQSHRRHRDRGRSTPSDNALQACVHQPGCLSWVILLFRVLGRQAPVFARAVRRLLRHAATPAREGEPDRGASGSTSRSASYHCYFSWRSLSARYFFKQCNWGCTPRRERRSRELAKRPEVIAPAARGLAEAEGWEPVPPRRLADSIEYSQPVL